MPWNEESRISLRKEFILLARSHTIPFSHLCQRFGISRKTGYKWLKRSSETSHDSLQDRSRKPQTSPHKTPAEMEEKVVAIRIKHPAWGGRKICHVLKRSETRVPAPSTITHILRRNGLLEERTTNKIAPNRFEHESPNDLWQMDFKGCFQTDSGRCDPLTIIDDHSRFNIGLKAMSGYRTEPVMGALTKVFRLYGLPRRMNMDNGQPWGSPRTKHVISQLTMWLIRLGIQISFSRPYHPQTNGKDERFHRSLKAEVLQGKRFQNLKHVQRNFDTWRDIYNHERPHEGINMAVPADRYTPSKYPFPEKLPDIEYSPNDIVRKVTPTGHISFKARRIECSRGLRGEPVAVRPSSKIDGVYDIYYCRYWIKKIDLNELDKAY